MTLMNTTVASEVNACDGVSDAVYFVNATITLILSALAVIGNTFIVLVFTLNKKVRNINNRVVILLAISDLMRASVVMITKTVDHYTRNKVLPEPWCGITACTSAFTFFFNPMILAMIAIVRYFIIVPWSTRAIFLTKKKIKRSLLFIFVVSVVFTLLPYFGVGRYEYSIYHGVCFANWAPYNIVYRSIFYIVVVGIAFPVLTWCYARLFLLLKRHNDNMKARTETIFFNNNQVIVNKVIPDLKRTRSISAVAYSEIMKPNLLREISQSHSVDDLQIVPRNTRPVITTSSKGESPEQQTEVKRRSRFYSRSIVNVDVSVDETSGNIPNEGGQISVTVETKTTVDVIVNKKASPSNTTTSKNQRFRILSKQEYQMTKTMILIFIAYIICWFPAAIVNIIALSSQCQVPAMWKFIIVTMVELKSVLNPILYGYGNREYRTICKNYIKKAFTFCC